LSDYHELTLEPAPNGSRTPPRTPPPVLGGAVLGGAPTLSRLRSLGSRLSRVPGLHRLAAQVRSVAEPAGALSFRRMPGIQRPRHETLSVLSANLWHDWPRFRDLAERLEDFARLVEQTQADLLLLQEVVRTPTLHAGAWLAERLGMSFVYSRSNGHRGGIGFEEGLAVLSRYPLGQPALNQLSQGSNPFVRRMALAVPVNIPSGERSESQILACSVHLGISRNENARQLTRLQSWIAGLAGGGPALVGGDFNTHETSPQMQLVRKKSDAQATPVQPHPPVQPNRGGEGWEAHDRRSKGWLDTFRHLHPDAEGTTHTLRWPWGGTLLRHRLDYIFLQPGSPEWQVLETRHLDAPGGPHSDHRAVLTRLKMI
jgi:endonuclease/exonuclease/phosphatase family metal-dependent hydrolase